MIVVITDEAAADLEHIGDSIAEDSPRRAVTFVAELTERCERLTDMPLGFPLVPRHEHAGVRRRPYKNYLIFYRVGAAQIDVLHAFHGTREYESVLFPQG